MEPGTVAVPESQCVSAHGPALHRGANRRETGGAHRRSSRETRSALRRGGDKQDLQEDRLTPRSGAQLGWSAARISCPTTLRPPRSRRNDGGGAESEPRTAATSWLVSRFSTGARFTRPNAANRAARCACSPEPSRGVTIARFPRPATSTMVLYP